MAAFLAGLQKYRNMDLNHVAVHGVFGLASLISGAVTGHYVHWDDLANGVRSIVDDNVVKANYSMPTSTAGSSSSKKASSHTSTSKETAAKTSASKKTSINSASSKKSTSKISSGKTASRKAPITKTPYFSKISSAQIASKKLPEVTPLSKKPSSKKPISETPSSESSFSAPIFYEVPTETLISVTVSTPMTNPVKVVESPAKKPVSKSITSKQPVDPEVTTVAPATSMDPSSAEPQSPEPSISNSFWKVLSIVLSLLAMLAALVEDHLENADTATHLTIFGTTLMFLAAVSVYIHRAEVLWVCTAILATIRGLMPTIRFSIGDVVAWVLFPFQYLWGELKAVCCAMITLFVYAESTFGSWKMWGVAILRVSMRKHEGFWRDMVDDFRRAGNADRRRAERAARDDSFSDSWRSDERSDFSSNGSSDDDDAGAGANANGQTESTIVDDGAKADPEAPQPAGDEAKKNQSSTAGEGNADAPQSQAATISCGSPIVPDVSGGSAPITGDAPSGTEETSTTGDKAPAGNGGASAGTGDIPAGSDSTPAGAGNTPAGSGDTTTGTDGGAAGTDGGAAGTDGSTSGSDATPSGDGGTSNGDNDAPTGNGGAPAGVENAITRARAGAQSGSPKSELEALTIAKEQIRELQEENQRLRESKDKSEELDKAWTKTYADAERAHDQLLEDYEALQKDEAALHKENKDLRRQIRDLTGSLERCHKHGDGLEADVQKLEEFIAMYEQANHDSQAQTRTRDETIEAQRNTIEQYKKSIGQFLEDHPQGSAHFDTETAEQ